MWQEIFSFLEIVVRNIFFWWFLILFGLASWRINVYAKTNGVPYTLAAWGWLLKQVNKVLVIPIAWFVVVGIGIPLLVGVVALTRNMSKESAQITDCMQDPVTCAKSTLNGTELLVNVQGAVVAEQQSAAEPTATPIVVNLQQTQLGGPTPTWTPPPTPTPYAVMDGVLPKWKASMETSNGTIVGSDPLQHPPISCIVETKNIGWGGGLENDSWRLICSARSPSLLSEGRVTLTVNGAVAEAWQLEEEGDVVNLGTLSPSDPTFGWPREWWTLKYGPTPVIPPTPIPPTNTPPPPPTAPPPTATAGPSPTATPNAPASCTVTVPSGSGWIAVAKLVKSTCGVDVDYNVLSSLNGGRVYAGQQTYTLPQ